MSATTALLLVLAFMASFWVVWVQSRVSAGDKALKETLKAEIKAKTESEAIHESVNVDPHLADRARSAGVVRPNPGK